MGKKEQLLVKLKQICQGSSSEVKEKKKNQTKQQNSNRKNLV